MAAKGIKGSTPATKPVKTTFIIQPEIMRKIKFIALMEQTDMTSLINESLQQIVKRYEKKNGEINI
jgi:predicted transcriptional regulator